MLSENDILRQIEVDPVTKCAHWVGSTHHHLPIAYKNGRQIYVRSFVYIMRFGPLGSGKRVIMTCGNWDCVNSRHMTLQDLFQPNGAERGVLTDSA